MKEWHLLARLEQERLTEWLLWLSRRDYCTEHPFVIDWMAIEAGHIAIGASLGFVALASHPPAIVGFAALRAKEIAPDQQGCDARAIVALDSLFVAGFYLLGYWQILSLA